MDLVDCWFANPDWWFAPTHKYDTYIVETFGHYIETELEVDNQPISLIRAILVHDQISRHCARVHHQSPTWIQDQTMRAVEYAQQLLDHPAFETLSPEIKVFTLLPLRHTRHIGNVTYCLRMIEEWNRNDPHPIYRRFYMATLTTLCEISDSTQTTDSSVYPTPSFTSRVTSFVYRLLAVDLICGLKAVFQALCNNFGFKPCQVYDQVTTNITKALKDGQRNVIVSLSGGIDSILVLNACLQMRQARKLDQVWAIHVNYGNRWRSRWDAEFVQAYCRFHQIRLLTRTITEIHRPRGSRSQDGLYDRSFYETATQNIRFRTYMRCMDFMGSECPVLLGHNHDDQLENILSNLKKQLHYDHLGGMRMISTHTLTRIHGQGPKKVTIIRPLLDLTKDQIFACGRESGFTHTKNSTPSWSERGRLRLQMLPFMRKFDPQMLPGLVAMATHLEELHKLTTATYLQWEAESTQPEGLLIELKYMPYPTSAYMRILAKVCRAHSLQIPRHRALAAALRIVHRISDVELPLSAHLTIRRSDCRVVILPR